MDGMVLVKLAAALMLNEDDAMAVERTLILHVLGANLELQATYLSVSCANYGNKQISIVPNRMNINGLCCEVR